MSRSTDHQRHHTDSQQPNSIDRTLDYVRVLIDYGSGRLKIALQYLKPGQCPNDVQPHSITFGGARPEIEQILANDDVKGLIFGRLEVNNWARENGSAGILYLWKLCLTPEYADSALAKEVLSTLTDSDDAGPPDIEELIGRHLRLIRDMILSYMRSNIRYSRLDIQDDIQIEAIVTVPAMWDDRGRGVMVRAATQAGFRNVALQLEPLCAAAADIIALRENECITNDDLICCVDGGHGTGDLTTVRAVFGCGHGSRVVLKQHGAPSGGLAGAVKVEEAAWQWVHTCREVQGLGGLQHALHLLGDLSISDFRRQLMRQVAFAKEAEWVENFINITISGTSRWSTIRGGIKQFSITIERKTMDGFVQVWAESLYYLIAKHLSCPSQQNVRKILLSGGASRCSLVRDYLEDRFNIEKLDAKLYFSESENPVARGGLKQYLENEPRELPSGCFWFVRDERWDYKVHTVGNGSVRRSKGNKAHNFLPDPAYTEVSDVDGTTLAKERLACAMKVGQSGTVECRRLAWVDYLDATAQSRLEIKIFHSMNRSHLRDHQPVRAANGNLRQEFSEWPTLYVNLPDLTKHNFRPVVHNGKPRFERKWITSITASEGNVTLEVRMLAAGEQWQWKNGSVNTTFPYRFAFDEPIRKELWDTYRNHLIVDVAAESTRQSHIEVRQSKRPRLLKRTMKTRSIAKGTQPHDEDALQLGDDTASSEVPIHSQTHDDAGGNTRASPVTGSFSVPAPVSPIKFRSINVPAQLIHHTGRNELHNTRGNGMAGVYDEPGLFGMSSSSSSVQASLGSSPSGLRPTLSTAGRSTSDASKWSPANHECTRGGTPWLHRISLQHDQDVIRDGFGVMDDVLKPLE